jgi:hypothetical protein
MAPAFDQIVVKHPEVFGGATYRPDIARGNVDHLMNYFLLQWREAVDIRIKKLCPNPSMIHIEFGLIGNGQLNALATTYDGIDIIAINVGAFAILSELFFRILAHPGLLLHIGDPAEETIPSELYDAEATEILSGSAIGAVTPKNTTRRLYSRTLLHIAIDFIFNHELGHVFNGHTSWLQNHVGLAAISERTPNQAIRGIDWLTIEMDADCFAVVDAMVKALDAREDIDTGRPIFPEETKLGSRRESLFTWCFATYCFFRIMAGTPEVRGEKLLTLTHPPAKYRQIMLGGTMIEYFKKYGTVSQAEFLEIHGQAALEAERAFSVLTGKPINPFLHSGDVIEDCVWLMGKLTDNWKRLRPQLDILKRGGNLAP